MPVPQAARLPGRAVPYLCALDIPPCSVMLWRRSDNVVFALLLGGADLVSVGDGVECKVKGILQVRRPGALDLGTCTSTRQHSALGMTCSKSKSCPSLQHAIQTSSQAGRQAMPPLISKWLPVTSKWPPQRAGAGRRGGPHHQARVRTDDGAR